MNLFELMLRAMNRGTIKFYNVRRNERRYTMTVRKVDDTLLFYDFWHVEDLVKWLDKKGIINDG